MAYSYKVFYGSDTAGPLVIPFPYLHVGHITVTSGLIPQAFTWINASTIQLTTPLEDGDKLVVRRRTPVDRRLVDFENTSLLTESALDQDSTQLLYCIQEILDSIQAAATGSDIDDGLGGGDVIGGGTGGYIDVQEIIDTVLENLQGQVRESHLYQTLLARINKIDMGPISLQARLDELDDAISGRVVLLENGQVLFNGNVADLNAAIADLQGTIALIEDNIVHADAERTTVTDRLTMLEGDLQNVLATEYDPLTTYFKNAIVKFNGDVYRCTYDNDGLGVVGMPPTDPTYWTLANDIQNLASELNLRMAEVERSKDALIAEDGRLHAMILDKVTIGDYEADKTAWAGIETRMTATEDALGNVQAVLSDLVQASPSDSRIATIEQKLWAGQFNTGTKDAPAEGTLGAEWTVKIDVNGNVAGVGLALDESTGSTFAILADRFAIIDPNGDPASKKMPFVVGKINGVWTVGIDGNMVLDGTLAASRILVDQSIQFSTLAYDVRSKMFSTSEKKTSELLDDKNLGKTANWSSVANDNGQRPENGATKNWISNGRLYGLPGFPDGVPVDNNSITIDYSKITGTKPPINALSIEQFGGLTLAQMIDWIKYPTHAITINGTYIDRTMIATKSILANHMDVSSLSAIQANLGEVTAGRMRLLGNVYLGDIGNNKYGLSIVHPNSGWSGLYYDKSANKVEFVVNKMGSGHSLTFDTADGQLRINGRVIGGSEIKTDASLTKQQLAVQQMTRSITSGTTYTYYHYLDRYPVFQFVVQSPYWVGIAPTWVFSQGSQNIADMDLPIKIVAITPSYIQYKPLHVLGEHESGYAPFAWGANVIFSVM